MSILKKILGYSTQEAANQVSGQKTDATLERLRRFYSSCPICNHSLSNHFYLLLSQTVYAPGDVENANIFFKTLIDHDWHKLLQFQAFDAALDAIQAFAIKCVNGQLALIVIKNPTEYFEPDTLLKEEILDQKNSIELKSLINSEGWESF